MNRSLMRTLVLGRIAEQGRLQGAPNVKFPARTISLPGPEIFVGQGFVQSMTLISGFYLALPANVFGIVIFPDGSSHNLAGGVHEAPPGLYKVQYVDGHERQEVLAPISEMSTDGEKITLTLVFRYKVLDPLIALRIENPVETLIEHVQTDVAQYIRTHAHTDLADSSEPRQDSKLLSFFQQRHQRRLPLSRAFGITGVEIKDFAGDEEILDIRRSESIGAMKNQLERQQVQFQQQLTSLRAQFKEETEKSTAVHLAALAKNAAEHKAEIAKIEAMHVKEKQEILDKVQVREMELEEKRRQLQARRDEFSQIVEAISRYFSGGNPANPALMKTITDYLYASREEMDGDMPASTPSKEEPPADNGQKSPPPSTPTSPSRSSDKVENLKNTLLSLLNPKK